MTVGQAGRPRQAAGVSGQGPVRACLHRYLSGAPARRLWFIPIRGSTATLARRTRENIPYAWVAHEVGQSQQDASRVRHLAGHCQRHEVTEGHLAHGDELVQVEFLLLSSLAPGGKEVVARPAVIRVVAKLAK